MEFGRLHGVAIALGLAGLVACAEEVTTPPKELIHTWHSKAEHLRGRSLEIRDEWVMFGASRFSVKMHPLLRVDPEARAGGTHYTLHYRGEGGEDRQLGVLYRPGRPATLQLDHRDELWVRSEDAAWLREEPS